MEIGQMWPTYAGGNDNNNNTIDKPYLHGRLLFITLPLSRNNTSFLLGTRTSQLSTYVVLEEVAKCCTPQVDMELRWDP